MSVETYENGDLETPAFQNGLYCGLKTMADFALACVLILVAAPIIALLAIAIKRNSPGPAFYSQTRAGLGGRPFRIWKLRTMFHDAEAITGPVWSARDDRRVTSIGRILRDTHLDELPQLWNVLRGEMSLVGPRPERAEIARRIEAKVPEFRLRLLVKPGLTGLAQLRVPPDVDIADIPHKLAQDLLYVSHQSPSLDMSILISTAFHFIGTCCVCLSRIVLARTSPSVRQDMGQVELPLMAVRHLQTNSISTEEPELSGMPIECSVAA